MTQGAYLKKDGETVTVKIDGQVKLRVPIITISSIVCYGKIIISPPLMGFCLKNGVTISFLSLYGRFLARVQGPVAGNVLLRKEQYRLSDDQDRSADIARACVVAKISNCRTVIMRAVRDHQDAIDETEAEKVSSKLKRNIREVLNEKQLDIIRGIEGESAKLYFRFFNNLILAQRADFSFRERNRRPPLDRVNALLSFIYTMLYHDIRSALETCGLDPAVGFLHRDRPGRMSLALDIMEEFRPFFADRLVLSLINLQKVKGKDFKISKSGAVLMNEESKKVVVTSYQTRKQDSLHHPFLGENMHIGILFQAQAILLARYIRGDIDGYPSFIWR
jgi:CRISPR-associated protein Cas1